VSGGKNVDYREEYRPWPAEKPFPLTPLEARYVVRGSAVGPSYPLSIDEFLELPAQLKLSDAYVMLRQT
jgi:hypothetical protein